MFCGEQSTRQHTFSTSNDVCDLPRSFPSLCLIGSFYCPTMYLHCKMPLVAGCIEAHCPHLCAAADQTEAHCLSHSCFAADTQVRLLHWPRLRLHGLLAYATAVQWEECWRCLRVIQRSVDKYLQTHFRSACVGRNAHTHIHTLRPQVIQSSPDSVAASGCCVERGGCGARTNVLVHHWAPGPSWSACVVIACVISVCVMYANVITHL